MLQAALLAKALLEKSEGDDLIALQTQKEELLLQMKAKEEELV